MMGGGIVTATLTVAVLAGVADTLQLLPIFELSAEWFGSSINKDASGPLL